MEVLGKAFGPSRLHEKNEIIIIIKNSKGHRDAQLSPAKDELNILWPATARVAS